MWVKAKKVVCTLPATPVCEACLAGKFYQDLAIRVIFGVAGVVDWKLLLAPLIVSETSGIPPFVPLELIPSKLVEV